MKKVSPKFISLFLVLIMISVMFIGLEAGVFASTDVNVKVSSTQNLFEDIENTYQIGESFQLSIYWSNEERLTDGMIETHLNSKGLKVVDEDINSLVKMGGYSSNITEECQEEYGLVTVNFSCKDGIDFTTENYFVIYTVEVLDTAFETEFLEIDIKNMDGCYIEENEGNKVPITFVEQEEVIEKNRDKFYFSASLSEPDSVYALAGNINGEEVVDNSYVFQHGMVCLYLTEQSEIYVRETDNSNTYRFVEKPTSDKGTISPLGTETMTIPAGVIYIFLENIGDDTFEVFYEVGEDDINPTGEISSTKDFAEKQIATLTLKDNLKIAGYYWGEDSDYLNNEYIETTEKTVQREITNSGTYYLTVADEFGNLSETVSVTYYKTTFDANGGFLEAQNILTLSGESFHLPVAQRQGYNFAGWNKSGEDVITETIICPEDDTTYYANWSEKVYTLAGYINSEKIGYEDCEDTLDEYNFVDGKLKITLSKESKVFIKTTDKIKAYVVSQSVGDNSVILSEGSESDGEKITLPVGIVSFELSENEDGTLLLSYTVEELPSNVTTPTEPTTTHTHNYKSTVTKKATCKAEGVMTYTCACGNTYTKKIAKVAHVTTKSTKKATYFATGYKNRKTCKVCKKIISKGTTLKKLKLKTPKAKYTGGKKKLTVKYTKVKDATGFQVKYKIGKKTVTKTYSTKKSVSKTIKSLKKGTYKVYVRAFVKSGSKKAYSSWSKAKKVKVKG